MARRIRCFCGKIYEPAQQPNCPACGAPAPAPRFSTRRSTQPPTPPSPDPAKDAGGGGHEGGGQGRRVLFPLDRQKLLKFGGIAAGGLALLVVLSLLIGGGGDEVPPQPSDQAKPQPASKATDKPAGADASSAGPAAAPPASQPVPDSPPTSGDLVALVAAAADGATIHLKAGTYEGSLVLDRPIRIVGDAAAYRQVVIRSSRFSGLEIKSKDVVFENLVFAGRDEGQFVISVGNNAEAQFLHCLLDAQGTPGLMLSGGSTVKASLTSFSNARGVAIAASGQTKLQLDGCAFSNNGTGLIVMNGAAVDLMKCSFEGHGNEAGEGTVLRIGNDTTSVTATDCFFKGNTAGLIVEGNSSLTMKTSTFRDNGVGDKPDMATQGLVLAKGGGRASFTGCVFEQNRQGLAAVQAGILELDDCRFTGNGLETSQEALGFFCDVISADDARSRVTLRKTKLLDSKVVAVKSLNGAVITLDDCEITGGAQIGLLAGMPDASPARLHATRTVVSTVQNGVLVSAGSEFTMEGGGVSGNLEGLVVSGIDAQATLNGVTLSNNQSRGLWCQGAARVEATSCTFQKNSIGVAAGIKGKPEAPGILTLTNCEFSSNTDQDFAIYAPSQVFLRNARTASGTQLKVFRENGTQFRADPPLAFQITPAPGSGSIPANKPDSRSGSSGRSRNADAPPKAPSRSRGGNLPPQRDADPAETVRKVLDEIDRAKRFFR
jgi:hypothetical protein